MPISRGPGTIKRFVRIVILFCLSPTADRCYCWSANRPRLFLAAKDWSLINTGS
jgi:hypothetical protein